MNLKRGVAPTVNIIVIEGHADDLAQTIADAVLPRHIVGIDRSLKLSDHIRLEPKNDGPAIALLWCRFGYWIDDAKSMIVVVDELSVARKEIDKIEVEHLSKRCHSCLREEYRKI